MDNAGYSMVIIDYVRNLIRTLCRYLFFVSFLPAISENVRLFGVLLKIVELQRRLLIYEGSF